MHLRKGLIFLLLLMLSQGMVAQNARIDAVLKKYNKGTVSYMTVSQLAGQKEKAVLFDAREPGEYQVSRIPGALWAGHETFDLKTVTGKVKDKSQLIVVYCSIGVRSEQIAEKIQNAGYTKVYNLYGGIFEWKNQGRQVVDSHHKTTEKVHTYSAEWSKYLMKGEKVY